MKKNMQTMLMGAVMTMALGCVERGYSDEISHKVQSPAHPIEFVGKTKGGPKQTIVRAASPMHTGDMGPANPKKFVKTSMNNTVSNNTSNKTNNGNASGVYNKILHAISLQYAKKPSKIGG